MRIYMNDNNLMVFLNKKNIKNLDFYNKDSLEDYLKDLFLKLNDLYSVELSGSYDITVYIDSNYGVLLEITNQNIDYFDYYDGIDMKITISKYKNFLYKLDNYYGLKKFNFKNIYIYDGNIYADFYECDFLNMGLVLENCEIIYGKQCDDIKKISKKIDDISMVVDNLV